VERPAVGKSPLPNPLHQQRVNGTALGVNLGNPPDSQPQRGNTRNHLC